MRGTLIKFSWIGLLFVACFSTAGCCSPEDKEDSKKHVGSLADYTESKEYLPFVLVFKRDGSPVFLDANNNPIKPKIEKFPMSTSKLYGVQTITLAFVEGSCNVLRPVGNNQAEVYTYPDYVCKLLGIPIN